MYPCFLIEPTPVARIVLRRYALSTNPRPQSPEAQQHMCDARISIGEQPLRLTTDGTRKMIVYPRTDERWTKECPICGYRFRFEDEWQTLQYQLYTMPNGENLAPGLDRLPIGAMWNEKHFNDVWCGADGKSLKVVLPDRVHWFIDGHATNSENGWTRTGEAPLLTVTPSILTNGYHGYLTNGMLGADLDRRTYN